MDTLAGGRNSPLREWSTTANEMTGDSNVFAVPESVCQEEEVAPAVVDNSCRQSLAEAPGVSRSFPCIESQDKVPAKLSALGKAGLKIERAREAVLDILRSGKECSEWFKTKDAGPAETFQSLNFLVDQHGPQDIFESRVAESMVMFRQPYVARATQNGGTLTTITINANGAFYRAQGIVEKLTRDGGPERLDGTRLLTVGSYRGDTLTAQIVTLLHELGHVIDLLPEDTDNLNGRSVRNTDEVLRHCRTEIEARSEKEKQAAKR